MSAAAENTNELPGPEALAAFREDLDALHREALENLGDKERQHLLKVERWGRVCTALGYGTAWILPNPISAWLMAQGNVARWAIIAHHVSHRGYDRVPGMPKRLTSKGFATGWRRFIDWPEWMLPEAWNFEHNVLHHYHTGEHLDPDLVERNFKTMRNHRAPKAIKLLVIALISCVWKIIYYAPNTLWMIQKRRQLKAQGVRASRVDEVMASEPTDTYHGVNILLPTTAAGRELWWRCYLPVGLLRFAVAPLLFLPLGAVAATNVLINALLAEIFSNIQSFLIIVPNHSGEDLHRFEGSIEDKGEFYWRQVTGSTNYTGGTEVSDFVQGYLNYQIEHHLWPSLPALTYRELQPKVQAVCERHGVPYVIEPLWARVKKMVRLMTGEADMPVKQRPALVEPEPQRQSA